MKKKILGVISLMLITFSCVFAMQTSDEELLRKELNNEIEKHITKENGYQNLTIDATFDINNVTFDGMHTVYHAIDNKEKDFVFENRYVTSARYNGNEIANVFYTVQDGKMQNVKVILDKASEDKDIVLNVAVKQMPTIKNKNEISLFIPNSETVVAFTENTYKMFVIKDTKGNYSNFVTEEADGTNTIDRNYFFELQTQNKIVNKEFIEGTAALQVILILLFAILAILAFLSYILINKDKINEKEKVVAKKTAKKNTKAKAKKTK